MIIVSIFVDLGIIIGIAIAVSAITVFLVVAVVTGSVAVFICIRTTKQKHTQGKTYMNYFTESMLFFSDYHSNDRTKSCL